jgi:UTP--glucose-1-phosphate uridylyltransferase
VEEVPKSETDKYGIVSITGEEGALAQISNIIEKPKPVQAPSNLAVVGRYLLTPRIFGLLETTKKGSGGEIQLTDAIAQLLEEERVLSYRFQGKRYDCGSKLGYLQATVEYALKHPELNGMFREYLKGLEL